MRLYHAIDLPDFESYCKEWALVSRQQLEERHGIKVPFYTDKSDKEKGLYDRCFGNLSHFWKLFWSLDFGTPSAYGLITLVFRTEAFASCSDVAVSTVGANAKDFDLATERLADNAKLGFALAGNTRGEPSSMTEFSTASNSISFDLLDRIIVQPVPLCGTTLRHVVEGMLDKFANGRTRPVVVEEPAAQGRLQHDERFKELLRWAIERKGNLKPWDVEKTLPEPLKEWYGKLKAKGPVAPFCERAFATLKMMHKLSKQNEPGSQGEVAGDANST